MEAIPNQHFFSSWQYAVAGFEDVLKRLRSQPLVEDAEHHCLYEHHDKYVWRCQEAGYDFAYKTQRQDKKARFMFRPSLTAREFVNYKILRRLDIPVPDVYAVGDTRCCFLLQETFLATSFIENSVDGRIFQCGREYETGHDELRHAFCLAHLKYLARLHDHGYVHVGFNVRNLLFRPGKDSSMDYFWIDVARMRPIPKGKEFPSAVKDLHSILHDLPLAIEQKRDYIQYYLSCRTSPCATLEALHEKVKNYTKISL